MHQGKPYNPLKGFDYEILNDPEFKEDAVREEIITPILKALGYSASGPNKIIRSRKLLHPFVSIGSARKEIFIVPDYLLEISGQNAWIIEAKSPSEETVKSIHVEQAYSYAIHSEIRVNYFVLCNGKYFTLYDVGEVEPVFHFPIQLLAHYWNDIKSKLLPENVIVKGHHFNKDLGLHLKRLGFCDFESIVFPHVLPVYIIRMNENLLSFSSTAIVTKTEQYAATFDFNLEVGKQLKGLIPNDAYELLMQPFNGVMQKVQFDGYVYLNVVAVIGEKMEETKKEIFLPLIVKKFLPNIVVESNE